MARICDPYRCDECGGLKQESNRWYLIFPKQDIDFEIGSNVDVPATGIFITAWQADLADHDGVKHSCGLDCVVKIVMKSIGQNAGA
jgi:hypothetical protein